MLPFPNGIFGARVILHDQNMSPAPSVSIVIPAYKHAHLIGAAIESVLSQSFTDWELIVINDGSPDGTGGAVAPYLSDPRIRYLEQENQGQSATRNRGIGMAQGQWIQLLDDDDLLAPGSLVWKVEFLAQNPLYCCVVGAVQFIDGEGVGDSDWQGKEGEIGLRTLFRGSAFASPGQALFRKADLLAVGLLDPSIPGVDDADLMFRLATHGRIMAVPKPALLYRWHGGNASAERYRMLPAVDLVIHRHLPAIRSRRARLAARLEALRYMHRYAGFNTLKFILNPSTPPGERKRALCAYCRVFGRRLLQCPLFLPAWCLDLARFTARRWRYAGHS